MVALALAAAALVATADQLTKWWALENLADGPVHVLWTLRLRLTFNKGASFSLGTGLTPFLTAAVVVIIAVLVVMARSATTRPMAVSIGLLLGGAVGNLGDRLFRDHGGAVVDFIDLGWWPIFNLADAAVVIGALLLVLVGSRGR